MSEDTARGGRWDRWLYLASGVLLAAVAVVVVVLEPGEPDSAGARFPATVVAAPGDAGADDAHPWIRETPGLDGSGYVGHVDEWGSGSVTLLWHGPADAVQSRILERARGAGIAVRIEQRRHGRQQLERAGRAMAGSSGTGVFAGFSISQVEPVSARFDGVVVTGEPDGGSADVEAALGAAAAAEFGVAVDVDVMVLVPADGG
jgi:hypothetical protein